MRRNWIALSFGFTLLTAAGVAPAAPFSNGSFETPGLPNGTSIIFNPGTIGPWVTSNPQGFDAVFYQSTAFGISVQDGSYSVGFGGNGSVGGVLSQTFDTVAGVIYDVKFFVAKQQDGAPGNAATYALSVINAATSASLYGSTGQINSETFQQVTFDFTATGTSSTLSFTDTGGVFNSAYNQQVDNFTVTARQTAVPEPASLLLLGAGLLGLGAARRARG